MVPGTAGGQSTASYHPNDAQLNNIQDILITIGNEEASDTSTIHHAVDADNAYRLQSSLLPHGLSKDNSLASEKMAE